MNKDEFLSELLYELRDYPNEESYGFLDYYTELIDDRMEEGMSEYEAVASLGSVQTVASQIKAELGQGKPEDAPQPEQKKKRFYKELSAWIVLLLFIGSPLWLSLMFVGGALFLSSLIVIWSLTFSFLMVEIAMGIAALVCIPAAVIMLTKGALLSATIYFGGAFLFAGLTIFSYFLFKVITKGCVMASKGLFNLVKKIFKR